MWKGLGGDVDEFWTYCLAADTDVLCSDLTWSPIADLDVGDDILAFEENSSGARYARKLINTKVLAKRESTSDVMLIRLSDGRTVKATPDHLFMVSRNKPVNGQSNNYWKRVDELQPGDRIFDVGRPWHVDASFTSGWMSGMLDGEGCVSAKVHGGTSYVGVEISQKPGPVLDKIKYNLGLELFDYTKGVSGSAEKVVIKGWHS